jgi:hypothetical protein
VACWKQSIWPVLPGQAQRCFENQFGYNAKAFQTTKRPNLPKAPFMYHHGAIILQEYFLDWRIILKSINFDGEGAMAYLLA